MDLKNVLDKEESSKDVNKTSTENIRTHKKPIQLKDIESRSSPNNSHQLNTSEDIGKLLEKEKKNVYKKKWNKLDLGMKLNLLNKYADNIEKTPEKNEQLKELLMINCKNGKLNKNSDVIYNVDEEYIENIKILINEENYKLKITETKKKQNSGRSKSNIERLLKAN
jgi:hypothetical protein